MQPLTAADPESRSADSLARNIEQLKALFPEVVVEGKIDFAVLRQLLGGSLEEREEKYGLNWHGKRQARQLALTPSTGTLRPCPEESVEWETTQNLMIEGDNLEVLKLLQKSYAGKVKLIYIDPPYNTGKDFVYPDDFRDNIQNYLELTGQVEGGRKLSSNTEASGRFHTDWLNMIYPRLKLARSLMSDEGAIFISIDETECSHIRLVCDDVFGAENFVEMLVWNKRIPKNDKGIGSIHEYALLYVKQSDWNYQFTMPKEGLEEVLELVNELKGKQIPIPEAEARLRDLYRERDFDRAITLYNSLDENYRIWGKINVSWPNARTVGPRYDVPHPISGRRVAVPDRGWRWKKETFDSLVDYENMITRHDGTFMCGQIWFDTTESTQPSLIKYLEDVDRLLLRSILSTKSDGGIEVENLFGNKNVMSYPKPTSLLRTLIDSIPMADADLILDFFAGSGTTGHAVMAQNAADGGNRRYILVQLPEPLDPSNKDQKTAADFCDQLGKPRTIAELTKERLRRAGESIRKELEGRREELEGEQVGLFSREDDGVLSPKSSLLTPDVGFRVFKLDSSNLRTWEAQPEELEQMLLEQVDHIKAGRSEEDILYELLLKLGLDLCVPVEELEVRRGEGEGGAQADTLLTPNSSLLPSHKVYSIGGGVLMACLAPAIGRGDVEALGQAIAEWHKELAPAGETTCVFRDSAFVDDVAKTNLAAILEQQGIHNVRSL